MSAPGTAFAVPCVIASVEETLISYAVILTL